MTPSAIYLLSGVLKRFDCQDAHGEERPRESFRPLVPADSQPNGTVWVTDADQPSLSERDIRGYYSMQGDGSRESKRHTVFSDVFDIISSRSLTAISLSAPVSGL